MRCLQILEPGRAEVLDLPVPEPGPREVRVKVTCCNTCPQWDLHLAAGEPMFVGATLQYPYTPGQPGHEMTGVVDAVGAEVTAFRPGQHVVAWKDAGHQRAGCYAEYVLMAEEHLLAVPADVDPLRVASIELAMCVAVCVLDLRAMGAVAGRRAAVNGLGPAGLVAAQLLRAEGAVSVVGFEPSAARREFAVARGVVDAAYDPRDPATDQAVPRRRGPGGVEVLIECCGYPDAVRWAMDRTANHVALFAVQRHDYTYAPGHGGLILVGYRGHHRQAAEYALERVLANELDLALLVSAELPLTEYREGIDLLRRQEAIKICYRP